VGTTSTQIIHRKTGPDSSETIRRRTVIRESGPAPELEQAEASIQKRDYAAAEPLLHTVVEHDAANYEAWFDLGFVENELGKTDESIAAYRKSVAAKPDIFEANLNLGLQLAKSGSPEAEQFLRTATQLKPTSHVAEGQARAWISLGHLLEKSRPEDALGAFHQAAALQPKDAEPHISAGLLLEQENKFADAEQEYKQAFALDGDSEALTGLANIYMQGRRFPEAEQYIRKLVAAHPEMAAAHIQLGRVLAAENKHTDAVAELEAGVKLRPTDDSAQRDLAQEYVEAGQSVQAEAAYRALVAAHPSDADLHRALAQALIRQKKYDAGQQELIVTLRLKPDLGAAYGDLAFVASENKNYPLALKALDARAKFLPEIPTTYFLRASAFDHLLDVKQAIANYRLFLNTANGKYPDEEWKARHRLIALEPKK
jgi:tetratricopeptide (TPR) repeat protein